MPNRKLRTTPYYLAEGIYLTWHILIKIINDITAKRTEHSQKLKKLYESIFKLRSRFYPSFSYLVASLEAMDDN